MKMESLKGSYSTFFLFALCKHGGGNVVCFVVGIDNFSIINDSLGRETGDDLLKQFVHRLKEIVQQNDVLGRQEGGRFIIAFHTTSEKITINLVLKRLFNAVDKPFLLFQNNHYVTVSIGISLFPVDSSTSFGLLNGADLALAKAKKELGKSYSFFDKKFELVVKKNVKYLSKIRRGIENGNFIPFYQPKIDLITGKVIGIEMLARWKVGKKLISPGLFILIVEHSGLIVPLFHKIYEQALEDIQTLQKAGYGLKIAVNLSAHQLDKKLVLMNSLV